MASILALVDGPMVPEVNCDNSLLVLIKTQIFGPLVAFFLSILITVPSLVSFIFGILDFKIFSLLHASQYETHQDCCICFGDCHSIRTTSRMGAVYVTPDISNNLANQILGGGVNWTGVSSYGTARNEVFC